MCLRLYIWKLVMNTKAVSRRATTVPGEAIKSMGEESSKG